MNNSPSNIFQSLLLLERYHQNGLAVLAATGRKGLIQCVEDTETKQTLSISGYKLHKFLFEMHAYYTIRPQEHLPLDPKHMLLGFLSLRNALFS